MTINNNFTIKLCCAIAVLSFLTLLLLPYNPTSAQHIDVFNIPREDAKEKTLEDVPELAEVEVTDSYTYKVMVKKERLDDGTVFARELEITALSDEEKPPYHWGQVDYYDRRNITQRQVRKTDFAKCFRTRTGVLYYLPNSKKVVDWGRWTMWDCRPSNAP
ncbi:MAG: hypothetical protein NOU37_06355 [Candidatus Brocadiales bacterium]|nr:hypothetical protein [Candidatus Bathyanammoxibius amoris]